MASVAEKRRRKKRTVQGQEYERAPSLQKAATSPPEARNRSRPTPERMARGKWASPQGGNKATQPMVDLASDIVGQLYQAGKITTSQEQAARLFQQLRAAYLKELGTQGYGSCLADNQRGYDNGDGDPQAIAEYRALEAKVGRIKCAALVFATDGRRVDLDVLRRALDAVAN